jgi:hypothetical protein
VPIYLTVGNKLLACQDDKILRGHGRTATGWGIALTIIAALWSLTNLTSSAAAASSHAVLFGAMLLALFLRQQPRILYAASLFALTTTAFVMTELNLSPNQFSIGWSSWAIAYIVVAFRLSAKTNEWRAGLTATLINAGFIIASFALVPTLFPYDGNMLAYALGNWLGGVVGAARAGRTTWVRVEWMARAFAVSLDGRVAAAGVDLDSLCKSWSARLRFAARAERVGVGHGRAELSLARVTPTLACGASVARSGFRDEAIS